MPLPSKVLNQSNAPVNLTFPGYLGNARAPNYVLFTVLRRSKSDKYDESANIPDGSVALPLPADLADTYNVTYSDDQLGLLSGVDKDNVTLDSVTRVATGMAGRIAREVLSGIGGVLTGADSESIIRYANDGAINPGLRNAFSGLGFKQHAFTFELVAKNAKEADSIRRIIRYFRYYSSPYFKTNTKAILNEPERFDVSFGPDKVASYLYKPGICTLVDMAVRYNSNGNAAFHQDGSPVEVNITLTFKEDTVATRNRIVRDYPQFNPLGTKASESDLSGNPIEFADG